MTTLLKHGNFFTPPPTRWNILDLRVSLAPLSSRPELNDAPHFQIKTSQVLHFCALILFFQSGESEPLDLGAPISSLDGLRVVLERGEPVSGKGKTYLV